LSTQAGLEVPNAPHRILLVDDDHSLRTATQRALARVGHHVECAADGKAGWETLQKGNFDLLITDNEMPFMSGMELVKTLRKASIAIPIILITGTPPEAELQASLTLLVAATLIKPFDPSELLTALESILKPRPA
jgi:DNA-binding response OmpR family regulator